MAVYTTVSKSQVNELLRHYDLPSLLQLKEAQDGIENSTYFITLADNSQYVLTLFEKFSAQMLEPYIQLTHHLNQQEIPVPTPLVDQQGVAVQNLANKPAVLVPKAQGKHPVKPNAQQCGAVGKALAQCHLASDSFSMVIPNRYGFEWLRENIQSLSPQLPQSDCDLLNQQIKLSKTLQAANLPQGMIHGDLFRDNVLMEENKITAMIDFNDAGTDIQLLDLAITVNDWCYTATGELMTDNLGAMLFAYQQLKPFTQAEQSHWPLCQQQAAARFWVSRLLAAKQAQELGNPAPKDPQQYRNLLRQHAEKALNKNNSH